MSSLSAPLQRSLVAKDVLSTLRYEILTGELKEGEYLREVAISKRMDVSRGPVRRALQQLEAEGLVACEENGRLYFIPNTSQGLPMSTFPGVYETVTEEIDKYSKVVFG